jgi:hypothetical protein
MIVHDLNRFGSCVSPPETDSILPIEADAMLSFSVTFQCFEPISGRLAKIGKFPDRIE